MRKDAEHFVTCAQMKFLEQKADESGLSYYQMMENAGTGAAEFIMEKTEKQAKKVYVFCGKGNNGGDGFVVARLLKMHGCDVKVYLTHDESEISGVAKIAFEKLKSANVEVLCIEDDVDNDAIIIDALLGISLAGAPRGNIKTAIDKINSLNTIVISVDIPSGLSADSGCAVGSVVKADYTYTFALDKIGLNHHQALSLCGVKKVLDIGIPIEAISELGFEVLG